MTATYIDTITDQRITDRLNAVQCYGVEWTGRMPADAERWSDAARDRFACLQVADVRAALERCDLCGDSAEQEIDMAISIAAEPDELPDGGCVAIR